MRLRAGFEICGRRSKGRDAARQKNLQQALSYVLDDIIGEEVHRRNQRVPMLSPRYPQRPSNQLESRLAQRLQLRVLPALQGSIPCIFGERSASLKDLSVWQQRRLLEDSTTKRLVAHNLASGFALFGYQKLVIEL